MKRIYKQILAFMFLSNDKRLYFKVEETGRERLETTFKKEATYSITEREAYLRGKVNLNGKIEW